LRKVFIRDGLAWYFEGKVLIAKGIICKVLQRSGLRSPAALKLERSGEEIFSEGILLFYGIGGN
jgi:hypothetical protein